MSLLEFFVKKDDGGSVAPKKLHSSSTNANQRTHDNNLEPTSSSSKQLAMDDGSAGASTASTSSPSRSSISSTTTRRSIVHESGVIELHNPQHLEALFQSGEGQQPPASSALNNYYSSFLVKAQAASARDPADFGPHEDNMEVLRYTVWDLVALTGDDKSFQQLQESLRQNGAITNEMLKQGLPLFLHRNRHAILRRYFRKMDRRQEKAEQLVAACPSYLRQDSLGDISSVGRKKHHRHHGGSSTRMGRRMSDASQQSAVSTFLQFPFPSFQL